METVFGGDRLGSGNKRDVYMHGYERSTHDLGGIFRSTMAAGTLVPFMKFIGLPGDTFDMRINAICKTHPTVGPLFGSAKVQADVFITPLRLFQAKLQYNALNVGRNMAAVKLPLMRLYGIPIKVQSEIDTSQVNPSCILAYLGVRGIGYVVGSETTPKGRDFFAGFLLAYWETYKVYYANKQEEIGVMIHTPKQAIVPLTLFTVQGYNIPLLPGTPVALNIEDNMQWIIAGATLPLLSQVMLIFQDGGEVPADSWMGLSFVQTNATTWTGYNSGQSGILTGYRMANTSQLPNLKPTLQRFPLENIDIMREKVMQHSNYQTPFYINSVGLWPYQNIAPQSPPTTATEVELTQTQEGLGIKTYQADIFNAWVSKEWIEGINGIAEVTAIDTSSGSFTVDQLLISTKVFNMLNRIAVSDGSYGAWMETVYDHKAKLRVDSPIYCGGLSKELVFQEVVSNAESGEQPLGTLGGRGVMADKHKGGNVYIKVDEISVIMGIISITPRIDYSQGNDWEVGLMTMDDFHKPAMDEIGFEDLQTEQIAWWNTNWINSTNWEKTSFGKVPAWTNYQTNYNRTFGNFAIPTNEMFMTFNRRYENSPGTANVLDITTYIDPSKFNFIFAQTSIDAQNYWMQVGYDVTCRRKMSARMMPNL